MTPQRAVTTDADARPVAVPPRHGRHPATVAAAEVALAAVAVLLDVIVPTLVILAIAAISLRLRQQRWGTLGFTRPARPGSMALQVAGLVVLWTLLQLSVFMPVVEHLTGERQDVSEFEDVEGNVGLLLALVALSWTVAAVGEETAYRGLVFTRTRDVFGDRHRSGVVAGLVVSAALFGLAHTEQGVVGVAVTTLDAVFLGVLRLRYRTLWAPILAHGLNNTIGLTAFFLAGPIHGLW